MTEFQRLFERHAFIQHRYGHFGGSVDVRANRRWPRGTLTRPQEDRLAAQMEARRVRLTRQLETAEADLESYWDGLARDQRLWHSQAFDEARWVYVMMDHRSIIGAEIKIKLERHARLYLENAETEFLTDVLLDRRELGIDAAAELITTRRGLAR